MENFICKGEKIKKGRLAARNSKGTKGDGWPLRVNAYK